MNSPGFCISLRRASVFCVLVLVSSTLLAENAYVKIPGIEGASFREGKEEFSDVTGHVLTLLPAADKRAATQCTLDVAAHFGAGLTDVIALPGKPLGGDVVLEIENSGGSPQTFYVATFKGGSATQFYETFADGDRSGHVVIRFTQLVLSIRPQKPDGSLDTPVIGVFDCPAP